MPMAPRSPDPSPMAYLHKKSLQPRLQSWRKSGATACNGKRSYDGLKYGSKFGSKLYCYRGIALNILKHRDACLAII